MWRKIKYGSESWSERENKPQSLSRYFSVIRNELPAKFRICKITPAETKLNANYEDLWKTHEKGLKEFNEILQKIDRKEASLEDFNKPEISLLDIKSEIANRALESCNFCEWRCGVNRKKGEKGPCGVGEKARVASQFLHYGEEPEIVPSYTIFFSGCTLNCQFCQNWDISQNPKSGKITSPQEIATSIEIQSKKNARNVNWVGGDPTPNLHIVLASLKLTETNTPSVWNSNMYLSKEAMKLLTGTQDIYLTDFKYGNDKCAKKYSKVPNYWSIITRNHKMAHKDTELIIRHLVLPKHVECCTKKITEWIKSELEPMVRFNLMGQYRPAGRAREFPELSKKISKEEMEKALKVAKEAGLKNIIR